MFRAKKLKKLLPKVLSAITVAVVALQSTALWAQEATAPVAPAKAPVSSFLMQLPVFALIFALLYFVVIAPQKKQQKQAVEFQKSLSRGDEIVTASGIIGIIAGLTERVVTLEISPGTELRILRSQVQAKLKELKLSEAKA